MNVKLLRKVQKAILAEPLKFDMAMWFRANLKSPCGTTACIAGHALALDRKWRTLKTGISIEYKVAGLAAKALDVSDLEAASLFYTDQWPCNLRLAYEASRTALQRAKVAARRIDLFIKTGGRE